MHFLRRFLMALFVIALPACGPPWSVVRQAVPNPLLGQKHFVVMPIDFSGLSVGEKSEAGYLAEKDEESRRNWLGDKAAMNEEFGRALTGEAHERGIIVMDPRGRANFVVHPKISWLEPGFYTYFANQPSEVRMTLVISDPNGTVVDEIAMRHSTPASLSNPAVGNRLRDDAEGLGHITGEYLASRVYPED
ncbi:MAG TPA: hypothetical protein VFB62_05360 [Polyangiaceae bacterium]|nr:hypothetical protein [Polyangiaceae bacterium]